MLLPSLISFFSALALALVVVPLAKRMAPGWGLVDIPDEKRKLHSNAIPLIGGLSIVFCSIVTAGVMLWIFCSAPDVWNSENGIPLLGLKLFGLLLGALGICAIGVCDDRFDIRGRQKLMGQFLVVTLLIAFGFRFEKFSFFGTGIQLDFSWMLIFSYIWLLLGINSVNLLDGADGFATTIGLLMSLSFATISCHSGELPLVIVAMVAAGSMLGFMRYNFPPASAYLGDTGSMLIGMFVASMALVCSSKHTATFGFFAPIALLAIPLFDTTAAIVRRRLTGRSIYTVDRGHLHHALLRKGFGPRKALLLFFSMCLMTTIGGTLTIVGGHVEYAIASVVAVIIFLLVGRVFGFAELRLIFTLCWSFISSFFVAPKNDQKTRHVSVQLQGDRDWDLCWQVLREFASKSQLHQMTMDLNLPWLHESFHAKYQQTEFHVSSDEQWSAELPLCVEDRIIGRVDVIGDVNRSAFTETVCELSDVLASLEPYLLKTMALHERLEAPSEKVPAQLSHPPFSAGQLETAHATGQLEAQNLGAG